LSGWSSGHHGSSKTFGANATTACYQQWLKNRSGMKMNGKTSARKWRKGGKLIVKRKQLDGKKWTLDLLFNRVDSINKKQEKMEAKMDMSTKVLDQMIKDEEKLSKQIAETGHVVAQLRMKEREMEEPPSPTFSELKNDNPFYDRRMPPKSGAWHKKNNPVPPRSTMGDKEHHRGFTLKMSFPRFDGSIHAYGRRNVRITF
jgi:hypothetical protein